MSASESYLPAGLPTPAPAAMGLDAPYWEGLAEHRLMLQRCRACEQFQWGPEWICHRCLSFDLGYDEVEATGRIWSWERPWHPVNPVLADAVPYIVVLVELPQAGGVRLLGNLLGDRRQDVVIGTDVRAVFEDHEGFTLVQWEVAS